MTEDDFAQAPDGTSVDDEEPFINDLEAAEMTIDFAYRWMGFSPDWYQSDAPKLLDQAWERAKYGDAED